MLIDDTVLTSSPLIDLIHHAYHMDETDSIKTMLESIAFTDEQQAHIQSQATQLVEAVRAERLGKGGIDAFMYQYDLSSEEGIALMCTAEALLRIPDTETIDKLLKDKLADADWTQHLGNNESFFTNAATWGLMLTGRLLKPSNTEASTLRKVTKNLVSKTGMPVIRTMVGQAMKILGEQFVMGANIDAALKRARAEEARGYSYSYDMLGEAARTEADAERYFQAYASAIKAIGEQTQGDNLAQRAEISVKLSALHPRYEFNQYEKVLAELTPRLKQLCELAAAHNIGLTVDAEEADRLDLQLAIMEKIHRDSSLSHWQGFGLALQAYQKRAFYVIDYLAELSTQINKQIPLRLVKGAYWDSEIKWAQVEGLTNYPVFTRKSNTDVSYLACAKKMIDYGDKFYLRFASHNAHTVATIKTLLKDKNLAFEFQCLHGMGNTLYDTVLKDPERNFGVRVYAPVGEHDALLPYLVRRLLENGANTSFVNRIVNTKLPIDKIIADPIVKTQQLETIPHPDIPLPKDIYGDKRVNSAGVDLSDQLALKALRDELLQAKAALPLTCDDTPSQDIYSPQNFSFKVGSIASTSSTDIEAALATAKASYQQWVITPVSERAQILRHMADLLETKQATFLNLLIQEAGKTIHDAVAEIREAVDFCRYYAAEAERLFTQPTVMPGPTGEDNLLSLCGRGVIVCISPWNFPLAIFLGQISAALVAGNTVIAKPAPQTPLIAHEAVKLFYEAGLTKEVLQLLPGAGDIGAQLVASETIAGVMFTGSTATAKAINLTLAKRQGPIIPFIAETGGINAMIVDTSALLEQAVPDIVLSAFGSAGQRCSALRLLYVREEIADDLLTMLKGAMATLQVGDPAWLATDVGPVIDTDALQRLQAHHETMLKEADLVYQVNLDDKLNGHFFAPVAFELKNISQLQQEVFGPILHIIRYKGSELDKVIHDINALGFGLTFGMHSRINDKINYVCSRIHAGNIYVNRNITGAVVGVQAFGGEGLSGTGPKAGGPHYLLRLATERSIAVNTTAAGGNASLMMLNDDELN